MTVFNETAWHIDQSALNSRKAVANRSTLVASAGGQDFELEDSFSDDDASFDTEDKDTSKALNNSKNSLTKRRLIDDLLEEKRLQRRLKEYDFDFDDDAEG